MGGNKKMLIVYLFLLIGIAGGYAEGLTDTGTFILLAGLTMTLLVKEVRKLDKQQHKTTRIRDHSEGN